VYTALLDYFKALMTPYMSFMIQAFTDLLESFSESEEPDPELWSSLVQVLGKSFEVDEAGMTKPPASHRKFSHSTKNKKQLSGAKIASNKSPSLSSPKSPSPATLSQKPTVSQTANPSSQTLSALSQRP